MGKRKKFSGSSLTPQQVECTIYCSGLPRLGIVKLREKLHTYFSCYSDVQKIKIKESTHDCYAFVQFTNPDGVKEVLKQSHFMDGCKLTVQPYRHRKSDTSQVSPNPNAVNAFDLNAVNDCETVSEQVDQVVQVLLLNSENYQRRVRIQSELLSLLKRFYPEARLHPYGSTINGVGTQESDLDLQFEPFPGYFDNAYVPCEIPKPCEVETGIVPLEVFFRMPPQHHLSFIREVFHSCQSITYLMFISAKVPIVTFKYQSGSINIQCDISCNNMLPVYNSQLLSLFSKLDSRVIPFLIILKQWAKAHHLLKRGQMSSYALQLLGIFFLQNTEPPIVPTVTEMMSLTTESRIIDGFETAFCDDVKSYPASLNTEPVEILIEKLLRFYWNFDFSLVICPRTGIATDRKEFVDASNTNFDKSALRLQDPFEIHRNLTGNVYWHQLMDFVSSCAKAERRYKVNGLNRDNKQFGILNVIRESVQQGPILHINRAPLRPVESLTNFSFRCTTLARSIETQIHNWVSVISSALVYIFNHALLFEARITKCAVMDPKLETAISIYPFDVDSLHQMQDKAGVLEKESSEVDGSDGKFNVNVKFTVPTVNCHDEMKNESQDAVEVDQPLDVTESCSIITYNEESNFESKLLTIEVAPRHDKSENHLATKKMKIDDAPFNSAVTGTDHGHEIEFLDIKRNSESFAIEKEVEAGKSNSSAVQVDCDQRVEVGDTIGKSPETLDCHKEANIVSISDSSTSQSDFGPLMEDITEEISEKKTNSVDKKLSYVNEVTAAETTIEVLVPYNAYKGRAVVYQHLSGQNPLDNDHKVSQVLKTKNGPLEETKKLTCRVEFFHTKKKSFDVTICSEGNLMEDLPLANFLRFFLTAKVEELFENNFCEISKFLLEIESQACVTFNE